MLNSERGFVKTMSFLSVWWFIYRYVYDDLGQLLREDNSAKSRTYVYSYDHAGNILSKKTYALTAAEETPSTLYSTNTYGYNDADWGDLLTSFNGIPFLSIVFS